jgi:AraC family transcriptional regulator
MIADSAEPQSVATVARAVGVHPVHLARTFRAHLGISPGDYARKRRLERATDLMLRPNASLTDVAHDAGYADQSHFTRDFVRAAGLTPAKFRAALR